MNRDTLISWGSALFIVVVIAAIIVSCRAAAPEPQETEIWFRLEVCGEVIQDWHQKGNETTDLTNKANEPETNEGE